uniref:F-box protein At3g07870-like n=1 Tax=Erigeron canadensis TaxID=72917 RepID=UPI001CB91593|nr:F-box protein At3g07870-like [Erigeron canadensis]
MSSFSSSMQDLPEHVTIDILLRLPVKKIIHCKCVCKKWHNIVSDPYFADLHLLRSPKGLMIHHNSERDNRTGHLKPGILKWVEIEDEPDHHNLQHDPVMSLDLNLATIFQKTQILPVGSVNGLICLWQFGPKVDNTYICNPITREYMILPRQRYYRKGYAIIVYGFGVTLKTNEYKVVRTFQGNIPPDPTSGSRPSLLEAEVYTLGMGHWRSLGQVPFWCSGFDGPSLNGHAHWIVIDRDSPEKLCAFDFDTETFKLFPSPPCEYIEESYNHYISLGVLKGCLCQADTFDSQLTIWVMKEYGVKESWHKEVVIKESISPDLDWLMWEPVYVIESLKNGTILIVFRRDKLLVYCPHKNVVQDTRIFDRYLTGMIYCPSFLKLQHFRLERVHVF